MPLANAADCIKENLMVPLIYEQKGENELHLAAREIVQIESTDHNDHVLTEDVTKDEDAAESVANVGVNSPASFWITLSDLEKM